jgi:oligopeptide transport system substrate-binding protein
MNRAMNTGRQPAAWVRGLGGLLVLAAVVGGGVGCRGDARPPGTVYYSLGSDPPQLDSAKATDTASSFVLGHVVEGLTSYDPNNDIVAAGAVSWELRERSATFHLRKEARWSDGTPVTARDYVFAWRTVVDPATASEYAFIMYAVKNGEAVNQGKLPPTALGVKAVDDLTLEVELERPCPYFMGLTAFKTYFPLPEAFYRARPGRYAATAQDMLYNGPFVISRWDHNAALTMTKNPLYWGAARVKIQTIDIPYFTTDTNAVWNLFADGKVDLLGVGRDSIKRAQFSRYRMTNFDDGVLHYVEFNQRPGRPTRNVHLRRAIQLVYDGREFVSKIIGVPGTRVGSRLIPHWIRGQERLFVEEHPLPARRPDFARARQELELARKELGGEIPELVWLTDDGQGFPARMAEYFQQLLQSRLGLRVRIDQQVFQQRLAKMTAGDFDLVAAGWAPDYDDAMTFADLFTSWNENNRGKYANARFDQLIREAQGTADARQRFEAIAEAERIAVSEVAVLPIFEGASVEVESPRVHGILRRRFGTDPDFTYATVDEERR